MATRPAAARPWDPYRVLDIDPDLTDECIGVTQKGEGCTLHIAQHNEQSARAQLAALPRNAAGNPMRLRRELEEIASKLLCQRWHQNQARGIADRWQRAVEEQIREDSAAPEESAPTARVTTANASSQVPATPLQPPSATGLDPLTQSLQGLNLSFKAPEKRPDGARTQQRAASTPSVSTNFSRPFQPAATTPSGSPHLFGQTNAFGRYKFGSTGIEDPAKFTFAGPQVPSVQEAVQANIFRRPADESSSSNGPAPLTFGAPEVLSASTAGRAPTFGQFSFASLSHTPTPESGPAIGRPEAAPKNGTTAPGNAPRNPQPAQKGPVSSIGAQPSIGGQGSLGKAATSSTSGRPEQVDVPLRTVATAGQSDLPIRSIMERQPAAGSGATEVIHNGENGRQCIQSQPSSSPATPSESSAGLTGQATAGASRPEKANSQTSIKSATRQPEVTRDQPETAKEMAFQGRRILTPKSPSTQPSRPKCSENSALSSNSDQVTGTSPTTPPQTQEEEEEPDLCPICLDEAPTAEEEKAFQCPWCSKCMHNGCFQDVRKAREKKGQELRCIMCTKELGQWC